MGASTGGQELLIGDVFRGNAAVVPDRPAAALDDAALTHRELDRAANRTARALRAEGVRHGDRVVCWADTDLALVPLFAACAKLGAIFAPLSARLGAAEALEVARLARPALLVADAARALAGAPLAGSLGARFAHFAAPGAPGLDLSLGALPADAGDLSEPALTESDGHVLFFTSGSTGRPKAVLLSHRASWLRGFQGVFRDEPRRTVCMFPMFHMAPWTLALAAWQTRGGIRFVPSAHAGSAARRDRARPREPLLWDTADLDPPARAWASGPRSRQPARARHGHLRRAPRARAPPARELPELHAAHLLRRHRDRHRRRARPRGRPAQARQRGAAPARRRASHRGRRRAARAQPLPAHRVLRGRRGHRARRSPRAGSTRAISARSTPRATSRSSAASAR